MAILLVRISVIPTVINDINNITCHVTNAEWHLKYKPLISFSNFAVYCLKKTII